MRTPRPRPRISAQVRKLKKERAEQDSTSNAQVETQVSFRPVSQERAAEIWQGWFVDQGWAPFPFQAQAWREYLNGHSGLISVPTGSGKSYAALGGPLMELLNQPSQNLTVVYITPLKALARDVTLAIRRPIEELGLPFQVELRTGDTPVAQRVRMKEKLPQILVITPESLALLMTETNWKERLGTIRAVILDEWHELLSSKRGSLLELTMARLRSIAPHARTWALSATIANLEEAAQVAVGANAPFTIVRQNLDRPVALQAILPRSPLTFPWFGRSGLSILDRVLSELDPKRSTLLFTNTRSQAERWYQEIFAARPDWRDILALHHGSLDREERERVESGVKDGTIRLVIATSSLDLGVDFPLVERVIQIGSTKGLARALQRAGRAYHRPGQSTNLSVCPTHLLEIVEVSALRRGLSEGEIEERRPLSRPTDVFVQFLLNNSYGDGYTREEITSVARSAVSFAHLSDGEIDWALKFVTEGGYSLQAYPQFRKLKLEEGRYRFVSTRMGQWHKLNMGTILSDSGVIVRFPRGSKLGMIDESFVSKLKSGDVFIFGGRTLRLIQVRDMNAFVRLASAKDPITPVWTGANFPISPSLSKFLRREFDAVADSLELQRGNLESLSPELQAFLPAARIQMDFSHIPRRNEILIELWRSREGHHLFAYPMEGRLVHEGLGHIAAYRLARARPNTISVSANDYGFELLSTEPLGPFEDIHEALTRIEDLEEDIVSSLNYPELAKRSFREIARVAGLLQQGYPGQAKTTRHLQMSSSLLFDVFLKYEPDHPLLAQAFREVQDSQLQIERLSKLMHELRERRWIFKEIRHATPFCFPLLIERMKSHLSTESLEDRIRRMNSQWEASP